MNNKQIITNALVSEVNELNKYINFDVLLALKREINIFNERTIKYCNKCSRKIPYYAEVYQDYFCCRCRLYKNKCKCTDDSYMRHDICFKCHKKPIEVDDNDTIDCNCYMCLDNMNKVKLGIIQTNFINNTRINRNILICEKCITTCHCGSDVLKVYNEKCYMCNLDTCITCDNRLTTNKCNSCNFCDNCMPEYCAFGRVRVCNNCNNSPKINYFEIIPQDIIFTIIDYLNVNEMINLLLIIKRCDKNILNNMVNLSKIGCWGCGYFIWDNYKCFGCATELCVNCVMKCELCDTKISKPEKYVSDEFYSCFCTHPYLNYARDRHTNDDQYGWRFKCEKCYKYICHNCAYEHNDGAGWDFIFCKNCK